MAKLREPLLQPEEGWKRFDDIDPLIRYDGKWMSSNIPTDTNVYKGTVHYSHKDISNETHTVVFSFYGTGFRIIDMLRSNAFSSYSNPINVEVDGVSIGSYSLRSSTSDNVPLALLYEKIGLKEGIHKVKVSAVEITFDAIDILGGELVTSIGTPLPSAESGWSRYDSGNQSSTIFKYNGTWEFGSTSEWYNGTYAYAKDNKSSVEFKFYGTKIRIISIYDTQQYRSNDIKITIDGVTETYSEISDKMTPRVLAYEKTNLTLGDHTVKIESGSSGTYTLNFDCIDIDYIGRILDYNEVVSIKDLTVGKKIRCNYDATTMEFTNLGKATVNLFPVAKFNPSVTPKGDFYFIMVEDRNGIKKLIADRHVQYLISFNSLLSFDYASKSGRPVTFDIKDSGKYKFSIGIPSGGTLHYDTLTNDWNRFISGKDNSIWNWQDVWSIVSSMSSYNSSDNYGMKRGANSNGNNWTFLNLPTTDETTGFRPMLLIEFPMGTNTNRFLLESNGEILSKLNNYKNVGELDSNNNPTIKHLLDFGMKDLNQLFEFTNKGYSNFILTESLGGKVSESNSINKADIFTTIGLEDNNIQWDLINYYKPLDILPEEFNVIVYNGILEDVEEDTSIKKYLLKSGNSLYSLNPSKYNSDVTSLIKIENAELSEQLFNDEGGNDLSVLKNLTLIKGLTDSTFKIIRYTK